MMDEREIQDALHATRVIELSVANPHGPLGLEQLAEAVAQATIPGGRTSSTVERSLTLPLAVWEKLDDVARTATKGGARRLSASDVAAALIQQAVKAS